MSAFMDVAKQDELGPANQINTRASIPQYPHPAFTPNPLLILCAVGANMTRGAATTRAPHLGSQRQGHCGVHQRRPQEPQSARQEVQHRVQGAVRGKGASLRGLTWAHTNTYKQHAKVAMILGDIKNHNTSP